MIPQQIYMDILMQIGEEIMMMQHLLEDSVLFLEEVYLVGVVRNNKYLHYHQQKLDIWQQPKQHKKLYGVRDY
jgi:hypothetical protein